MVILVVFLVLVALGALLVHSNHRTVDRLVAARPGTMRVETVKSHQVDVTVRQHAATGWRLVNQSSAKSFGSSARVTLLASAALVFALALPAVATARVHHRLLAHRSVAPLKGVWRKPAGPLTPTATPVQTFTVIGPAIPARVEAAVAEQYNSQVAPAWKTPDIAFGAGGIPVYTDSPDFLVMCGYVPGCHTYDGQQSAVYVNRSSVVLSHEVIETMVDPTLAGREICDPVNGQSYEVAGVAVAAFVDPAGRVVAGP